MTVFFLFIYESAKAFSNHHLPTEASLTCLSTQGQFHGITQPDNCCTTNGKWDIGTQRGHLSFPPGKPQFDM